MKLLLENWREFLNKARKEKKGEEEETNVPSSMVAALMKRGGLSRKEAEEMVKRQVELEEADDPCWEEYEMVGMKKKGGKEVPNCVPIKEEEIEEAVDKDSMPCNKPRTTQSHKGKSHVVKACQDGKEKIIPFGEKGASTAGAPKKGESEKMKKKRKSFKSRHAKNIKKGKMSAAYWADKVKW